MKTKIGPSFMLSIVDNVTVGEDEKQKFSTVHCDQKDERLMGGIKKTYQPSAGLS